MWLRPLPLPLGGARLRGGSSTCRCGRSARPRHRLLRRRLSAAARAAVRAGRGWRRRPSRRPRSLPLLMGLSWLQRWRRRLTRSLTLSRAASAWAARVLATAGASTGSRFRSRCPLRLYGLGGHERPSSGFCAASNVTERRRRAARRQRGTRCWIGRRPTGLQGRMRRLWSVPRMSCRPHRRLAAMGRRSSLWGGQEDQRLALRPSQLTAPWRRCLRFREVRPYQ